MTVSTPQPPKLPKPPAPAPGFVLARLRSLALADADAPALSSPERPALRRAALVSEIEALQSRLHGLGLRQGDLVALLLPQGAEMVVASLAAMETAVAVPLDPDMPDPELLEQLRRIRPRLLLASEERAVPERALDDLGVGLCRLGWSVRDPAGACRLDGARHCLPAAPPDDRSLGLPPGTALLLQTSGTTSMPKLVPLTRSNLLASAESLIRSLALGAGDRCLNVMPQFHIGGLWDTVAGPLLSGGSVVCAGMYSSNRFEQTLRGCAPTWTQLVPAMLQDALGALSAEGRAAARGLRFIRAVSAALPGPLRLRAEAELGVPVIEIYGTTETAGVIASPGPLPARCPPGSLGRSAGATILIVREDGTPAAAGESGEVLVRGASVSPGYVDAPAQDSARFTSQGFRTGDLGRLDADGNLYLTGRVKELINRGGEKVSPAEVDAALLGIAWVRDAACFPLPHDVLGEEVAAALVLAPEAPEDAEAEVRGLLRQRLSYFKLPTRLFRLDALPRTAGGKLQRHRLPEITAALGEERRTASAAGPGPSLPRSPVARSVAESWAQLLGRPTVGPDEDFFELGGNSLRAAYFISSLQDRFPDTLLYVSSVYQAPTPALYEAFLRQHYPELSAALEGRPGHGVASSVSRLGPGARERFLGALGRPLHPGGAGTGRRAQPARRNPKAVFILSPPRSGSTLLRAMLAGHPGLFAPPELYLLSHPDMASRRHWYGTAHASQLEGLVRAAMAAFGQSAEQCTEQIARMEQDARPTAEVYGWLQRALGERLLVDKTPFYAVDAQVLARMEEDFEQPLYVHLSRHPYGMIRSFEEARLGQLWWPRLVGPTPAPGTADCPFAPRELAELLWQHIHATIVDALGRVAPARQCHLRYEDLVAEPERAMRRLCEFLALPFDPGMLSPLDAPERKMTDGLRPESRMIGDPKFHRHRGIDPGAAYQWRQRYDRDFLDDATLTLASALGHPETVADSPVASTLGQETLLPLARARVDSAVYNIPIALELRGPLQKPVLVEALNVVDNRHAALRTHFPARGERSCSPAVRPPGTWLGLEESVQVDDTAPGGGDALPEQALRWAGEVIERPFDLEDGPLWRAALAAITPERHLLVLVFHHLIFDGFSRGVLLRDLSRVYEALLAGRRPSAQAHAPGDHAPAGHGASPGRVAEASLAWWAERLGSDLAPPCLPGGLSDQPCSTVRTATRQLPAESARALRERARALRIAPAALVLGAAAMLLHRHTGQRELLLCTALANRDRPELAETVGYLSRTVPVRLRVPDDGALEPLLRQSHGWLVDASSHPGVNLHSLSALPALARLPMNAVLVSYQEREEHGFAADGLDARLLGLRRRAADFRLALQVEARAEGLALVLDLDEGLFGEADGARLLDRLTAILESLLRPQTLSLSDLPDYALAPELLAAQLRAHPQIDDAAVALDPVSGRFDAWLVLNEHDLPELPALRRWLAENLEPWRQLRHLLPVAALPRRPDGSVDPERLPQPALSRPRPAPDAAPRTELERLITEVWRRVLWLDAPVGADEDFRELGGHSLLAVRMVAELERELGRELPARVLSRLGTPRELARSIERAELEETSDGHEPGALLDQAVLRGLRLYTGPWAGWRRAPESTVVGLNVDGPRVPLFWCLQNEHELKQLARWLGADQPVFGMRSGNEIMVKTLENIRRLAAYYAEEIELIHPAGPLLVGGNCQAAVIAFHVARLLRERGRDVPLLYLHEKFVPFAYDGAVALTFGRESERNPYLASANPLEDMGPYYTGPLTLDLVAGGHGQFFHEPFIQDLARALLARRDALALAELLAGGSRLLSHPPCHSKEVTPRCPPSGTESSARALSPTAGCSTPISTSTGWARSMMRTCRARITTSMRTFTSRFTKSTP